MSIPHKLFLITFCLFWVGWLPVQAKEFTVLVYNVENLFDVDGVALYRDYAQDGPDNPFAYSRRKLLTKLNTIGKVLKTVNEGAGPELILFQELEADFTPSSKVQDLDVFLQTYKNTTVANMLTVEWQERYAGLPSVAWLIKALHDAGMNGYQAAVGPTVDSKSRKAHTNAVFSKFPIVRHTWHPLEEARDILEAEIDVEGSSLFVYVNHWKSGASNKRREPLRVQNAKVLRKLLDDRLKETPDADVIVGGDLNSHYNHSLLYPDMETGINHHLGSQGDEMAIRALSGPILYNLWFELEPGDRYSEVFRGKLGTLMHLLVTRGLYDQKGITYVDNSFQVLQVPDLNSDALGRPLDWTFAGLTGGGASDHFPIFAKFKTSSENSTDYIDLKNPSRGDDAPSYEIPLDLEGLAQLQLEDGSYLNEVYVADYGYYVGKIFEIKAKIVRTKPLKLSIDGRIWPAYAPDPEVSRMIEALDRDGTYSFVASLDFWKEKAQLLVDGVR